jgi:hypothetical protein
VEGDVGEEPIHERRLHARAYALWASLLKSGPLPVWSDLDPAAFSAFGDHGVVVVLGQTRAIAFLGERLRDEAGLTGDAPALDAVPDGSLLAALLARLPAMLAVEAPHGFEAAQDDDEGAILYRGIWLPFADRDGLVMAALGVIGWKHVVVRPAVDKAAAIDRALPPPATPWGDGPGAALAGDG